MGATVAQREIMRRAGTRLIDWETVRGIAAAAWAPMAPAPRRSPRFVRGLLPRCAAGSSRWWLRRSGRLPAALETPAVIDRREWIDLNLATFERLFDRIEQIMATQTGRHARTRAGSHRQPLDRQPAARLPDDLPGAQGARPVRHQPAGRHAHRPRPAALRGAEHPCRRRTCGCRSTSSAPSSRCTRRRRLRVRGLPWLRRHFAGLVASRSTAGGRLRGLGGRLRSALANRDGGHWLERLMTPPSWTRSSAPRR